jgi:hypothetical protein
MTNNTKLRDELLRQNGLSSDSLPPQDREQLHQTIRLSEQRVRRLKWVVVNSWIIAAIGYFLGFPICGFMNMQSETNSHGIPPYVMMLVMYVVGAVTTISFIVAVVSTISLLIRGGSLRSRQMEDIRLSLRDLENDLRKSKQQDE